MKIFLKKSVCFAFAMVLLMAFGLFMPVTPRVSKSMLFSELSKDSLLRKVPSPRIIFVGGSNIAFGLNSQTIKDRLFLNPINTGVHAGLGLKFMIESVTPFIRQGDVVVLVPEYQHFFRDNNYGTEELLRSAWEVDRQKLKLLNGGQVINLLPFVPKFAFSRFNPMEYIGGKEELYYSIHSFNQYGDAKGHWAVSQKISFDPYPPLEGPLNQEVINEIMAFRSFIEKVHARLLISFPPYLQLSFRKSETRIMAIQDALVKKQFTVIGTPQRYCMDDSLFFDTPYHLNKKGLDLRTEMFISDFKELQCLTK